LEGQQKFWRNFRSLASANLISFCIMVGMAPVLGWVFNPTALGYLAYFMFAFQMMTSICTFRFDRLVPNSKSLTEELGLLLLGAVFLISICSLTAIVIYTGPSLLAKWEGYQVLGHILLLVPIAVFGMGLRSLASSRFVKNGDLRPVSSVKIRETIGNAGSSILLGLLGATTTGLIWARLVAAWVGLIHLFRNRPISMVEFKRLNNYRIGCIFKRHWWSAAKATGVSFTNTLSTNIAIVLLGAVASAPELGLYLMVTRLISTPIRLGANALSQSFWSRAAELARQRKFILMRQEYLSLVGKLTLIALIIMFVLVGIGFVIEMVFPPKWAGLGAAFLAFIPIVLGLVTMSSSNHLIVFDRIQLQLLADGTRLALMVTSITLLAQMAVPFWCYVLAVSLSSLSGHVVMFIVHLYAYHKAIKG